MSAPPPGLGRAAYILAILLTLLPLGAAALGLAGLAGQLAGERLRFLDGAVPVTARVEGRETDRTGSRGMLSVTELAVTAALPDGGTHTGRVILGMVSARPPTGATMPLLWNPSADPPLREGDPLTLWEGPALLGGLAAALYGFCLWAMAAFARRRAAARSGPAGRP
jgi:hypothetical protein